MNNMKLVVLWVGGLLIVIRCVFPIQYLEVRRVRLPLEQFSGEYIPTTDFTSTILQVIALGVIMALLIMSFENNQDQNAK